MTIDAADGQGDQSKPVFHRRHAVAGFLSAGGAQIVKVLLTFGSTALLARLLSPTDFGLFAMTTPIVFLAGVLQNLGLSHAAITARDLTRPQSNALFWIATGVAVLVSALLVVTAGLTAQFYDQPELVVLQIIMALAVLLNGAASQPLALAMRQMAFQRLALLDVVAATAGTAAGLIAALVWRNYWALPVLPIVTAAITLGGAMVVTRWFPGRPAPLREIKLLLSQGGGLAIYSLTDIIMRNADKVLIGRFLGPVPLGLYDRSYKLGVLPLQQIGYPLGRVMMPSLTRLFSEPRRYRRIYLATASGIMAGIQPGVIVMLVTADILVPFLLGPGWEQAVPIFQWLGIGSLLQCFTFTLYWLFATQGRAKGAAWIGIFSTVVTVAAIVIGLRWGVVGVAACCVIADFAIRTPVHLIAVARRDYVGIADMMRLLSSHAPACTGAYFAIYYLRSWLGVQDVIGAVLLLLPCYAAYGAFLLVTPPGRTLLDSAMPAIRARLRRRG